MYVFLCAGCGEELTAPLSQVALPIHAHQSFGNGLQLPVLMEPGTFAVDPEPYGPPYRTWEEVGPDEAAARGIHAPVSSLSYGPAGAVAVAPGDVRATILNPDRRGGGCCGLAGGDGPNMTCEACGLPVATRIDDCSQWEAVWLDPRAVHRLAVDGDDPEPPSWDQLLAQDAGTPPYEPLIRWGSRPGPHCQWSWSPRWEAAAGCALAHLLAASHGRPVTVPDGLAAEMFQRALDTLLRPGPSPHRAHLAGPGLPGTDAGILLVPTHPRTGQTWTPPGTAHLAPLPFGVWHRLAFPPPEPTHHRIGSRTRHLLTDEDPPPPPPNHPLRIDWDTFRHALVRLPAARTPWMRRILPELTDPDRYRSL
ncbi:hypothetical protein [Streptomyces sp. NPDC021020]|uniref:hypothetical protein n=1 Tax=Streptomyces sp. NPDC021020 TaxID=3365109 RepID=UPI0037994379